MVRRRRMVRTFEDRALPKDAVDRILANAVRAPSAGFSQGWAFLVLDDGDDQRRFWEAIAPEDAAHQGDMPLLIVCLSHKQAYLDRYAEADKGWTDRDEARWPAPYWDIDTGFAALMMLLTAVDAGLGALFFGIVPHRIDRFRTAFGVPDAYKPIGVVAVGYAADSGPSGSARTRQRRPIEEVIHRGRW